MESTALSSCEESFSSSQLSSVCLSGYDRWPASQGLQRLHHLCATRRGVRCEVSTPGGEKVALKRPETVDPKSGFLLP